MKFLLAPNAMKGALSASRVAAILAKSLRRKFPDAEIVSLPVADGGNGTLECLMNALGGTIHEAEVTGPVPDQKVTARYGITPSGIGIIESAEVIGLHLHTPSPESIARSTTAGIGELIRIVSAQPINALWVGLGGTATNDGGAGMAQVLGWDLADGNGERISPGAISLLHINRIRAQKTFTLPPVTILSDVNVPLLGPTGATAMFARQKGGSEDQLPYLESALRNFSETVLRDTGKDLAGVAGSGAAGGLGYGLMTFCGGTMVSGIDHILDTIAFDPHLVGCDLVVTAEGTLDRQTMSGKGIAGIVRRAQQSNKPVHALVGRIAGDAESLRRSLGLASLTEISPRELTTEEAMRDASWLLADAVFHKQW